MQDALNALPATGGKVCLSEGAFSPPTLTIPNKPIEIVGAGLGATIVNIPAGGILFDMDNDTDLTLRAFTADGNDSVGQKFLDTANAVVGAKRIHIEDVEVYDVETVFSVGASGNPVIHVVNAKFELKGTTGKLWSGGDGSLSLTDVNSQGAAGSGGISGNPSCYFVNSSIKMSLAAAVGYLQASACVFFDIGGAGIVVDQLGGQISACYFEGTVARHLDFLAAGTYGSEVSGCEFQGWTSEAIRTASQTGLVVSGCRNCKVTEIGGADNSHYSGSTGFYPGSTIIGPLSLVDDKQTRQTTTTPYTVAVTDRTLLIDATAGAKTVNLPAAASNKWRVLTIKKIDVSANTVTVDGSGGETIDDALTQVLSAQFESIAIQSDGVEWWVL